MKILPSLLALLALTACAPAAEIPEDPPPLPVKIEKAARAPFRPTLVLLGVVRPAKEADVMLPSSGRLHYPERFRNGLSSGVQVRAGEVLARLVNGDTESAVAEARLRLAAATSDLARFQKAFDLGVVPAVQLATYKAAADLATQQWEAARTRQGTLELRSPVTGWLVVERQFPPEGEVQPGTLLARVAAGGPPRVEARAAAGDRGQLHNGLEVRFVLPGISGNTPEAAGRGVIREISPLLEAGGTAPVVAEVTSGAGLPAPGEGVEVDVELDPRPDAITVPEEALVIAEGGTALFVMEEGLARRRTVTTGGRADGRIEVISGLAVGDKVVVNGAALLSDGARVEAVQEPPAKALAAAKGEKGQTP